jgi:opacity protein-like surface antigen
MNIKAILLGSTAAILAVSGARAADAVVAPEPEPAEYVRVCDTYGTGFYYIPGTEVCLKVGGYLRYDIGAGDLFGDQTDADDDADSYHKRQRFQLRMDARSETELGTLQGKVAINFDWATSNGVDTHPVKNGEGIERAWVKLGGFMIGVEDSLFSTWTGYTSGVVNDGLIPYGPFTTHQISYTFDAGNGFSLMAGVEEGNDDDSFYSTFGTDHESSQGAILDYVPHVLAGAAYKAGIFGVSAIGAYDSVQEEFAAKARLDVTPNDMFSFFVMGGWTDDNGDGNFPSGASYANNGGNFYATWGGDWAIWAGGAVNVNDRITLNGEFGYNALADWSIDADVNVTVVPGFVVTPGVGFRHGDGDALSGIAAGDNWGGYLRTQFTF